MQTDPPIYLHWTLTLDMDELVAEYMEYRPDAGNIVVRTVNAITSAGIKPESVTIEDGHTIRLVFASFGQMSEARAALDSVIPLLWLLD